MNKRSTILTVGILLTAITDSFGQTGSTVQFSSGYYSPFGNCGSVTTRDLEHLSKKTVAPVLFVDGHVQYFNLKKHFQDNPQYPAEPTPDMIWYKAME